MSGSIVFRTSSVTYSKEQVLRRVERSNKTITTVVRFKEPVSKEQQALMHELFSSDEEMVEESATDEENAMEENARVEESAMEESASVDG